MESLCHRLEMLSGELAQSIDALNRPSLSNPHESPNEDLLQAAHVLRSMPEVRNSIHDMRNSHGLSVLPSVPSGAERRAAAAVAGVAMAKPPLENDELSGSELDDEDVDSELGNHDLDYGSQHQGGTISRAGALVRDSYGRLR